MSHDNETLADLLSALDVGTSVAETDQLLEVARVETSAFRDLLNDRVDLIPGTKGSGKSALFRIFVRFLPEMLFSHGVLLLLMVLKIPGTPSSTHFGRSFNVLMRAGSLHSGVSTLSLSPTSSSLRARSMLLTLREPAGRWTPSGLRVRPPESRRFTPRNHFAAYLNGP